MAYIISHVNLVVNTWAVMGSHNITKMLIIQIYSLMHSFCLHAIFSVQFQLRDRFSQ